MIARYKIDANETIRYNACVVATPVENGEWVKYEDVESILNNNIIDIFKKYKDLSDKIEGRWKQLIGFGCGYFHNWKIQGDLIVVTYERPSRQGGGISDERYRIPMKCFEVESIEESKKLFEEYINDSNKTS